MAVDVGVGGRCAFNIYTMASPDRLVPMLDLGAYDRVVSLIYEAALVPARWDVALTSMISQFAQPGWGSAMVL